jgi:hypothetical protein
MGHLKPLKNEDTKIIMRMTQTNPFWGDTLSDMPLWLYRAPPSNQLH